MGRIFADRRLRKLSLGLEAPDFRWKLSNGGNAKYNRRSNSITSMAVQAE